MLRTCPVCTQTDDHPRHVWDLGPDMRIDLHMDCCAITRNCRVCQAQLAGVGGAGNNPTGDDLRAYLVTTGPTADMPGWTAPEFEEAV